jgi:phospholipid/cholesterol/gamma-HCH transport system substrate-binding protein
MTPVLADLHDAAPDINRMIIQLGPFSQAALPAVDSLGETAKVGTPAITAARPVIRDLRDLGKAAKPVALTARQLLESFQKTQGIERFMDYVFYQVAAINGFDAFGHYLRAGLIVNTCSTYSIRAIPGCSANFAAATASASAATSLPRDQVLLRTAAALREALAGSKTKAKTEDRVSNQPLTRAPAQTPVVKAPQRAPSDGESDPLLDYLFGGDG